MTREEAERLFVESKGLIGMLCRKYRGLVPFSDVTPDDLYQMVRLAVWEAALTYKPSAGSFTTYAGLAAYRDLQHARRVRVTKGRYESYNAASLDLPVGDGTDAMLGDLLPSGDDMEAHIIAATDLAATRSRLKPKERQALDMRMDGMKQREIAAALGCSQVRVHKYLKKAAAFAE